ncbi:unnamed protein product, partial [Prorocentrum cordatum]
RGLRASDAGGLVEKRWKFPANDERWVALQPLQCRGGHYHREIESSLRAEVSSVYPAMLSRPVLRAMAKSQVPNYLEEEVARCPCLAAAQQPPNEPTTVDGAGQLCLRGAARNAANSRGILQELESYVRCCGWAETSSATSAMLTDVQPSGPLHPQLSSLRTAAKSSSKLSRGSDGGTNANAMALAILYAGSDMLYVRLIDEKEIPGQIRQVRVGDLWYIFTTKCFPWMGRPIIVRRYPAGSAASDEFRKLVGSPGIYCLPCAVDARWQIGSIERAIAAFREARDAFDKMASAEMPTTEMIGSQVVARNDLTRIDGFSPLQRYAGRTPTGAAVNLSDEPHNLPLISAELQGGAFSRDAQVRRLSRLARVQTDNSDRVKRAGAARFRSFKKHETGDLVFVCRRQPPGAWRKKGQPRSVPGRGRRCGSERILRHAPASPGQRLGLPGAVVNVALAGRLNRVAPEQLRPAIPSEEAVESLRSRREQPGTWAFGEVQKQLDTNEVIDLFNDFPPTGEDLAAGDGESVSARAPSQASRAGPGPSTRATIYPFPWLCFRASDQGAAEAADFFGRAWTWRTSSTWAETSGEDATQRNPGPDASADPDPVIQPATPEVPPDLPQPGDEPTEPPNDAELPAEEVIMEAPPSDDQKDRASHRPIDVDTDAHDLEEATAPSDNLKSHRQSPGSPEPPIKKQRFAIATQEALSCCLQEGGFYGGRARSVQQRGGAKVGDPSTCVASRAREGRIEAPLKKATAGEKKPLLEAQQKECSSVLSAKAAAILSRQGVDRALLLRCRAVLAWEKDERGNVLRAGPAWSRSGFGMSDDRILQFLKPMCGFVLAPCKWRFRFKGALEKLELEVVQCEPCVVVIRDGVKLVSVAILRVDDAMIAGDRARPAFLWWRPDARVAFEWAPWDMRAFVQCGTVSDRRQRAIVSTRPTWAVGWRAQQPAPWLSAEVFLQRAEISTAAVSTIQKINKLIRAVNDAADVAMLAPAIDQIAVVDRGGADWQP